jgi:putative nucleotidyltransferase with HDIG domain
MKSSETKQGCSNNNFQSRTCCSHVVLCDTVIDVANHSDVDSLMDLILTRAAGTVEADHGFFFQYDPDAEVLELKKALGLFSEHIGYQVTQGAGLMGTVLQSGKPIAVNDYQSWEGRHPDPRWDPIQAITGIPLAFKGHVTGEIGLVHTDAGKTFENNDMVVLTHFAALANTALTNQKLSAMAQQALDERKRFEEQIRRSNDKLQESFIAMINALASAIEMKDPYTAAHQRWVTRLACVIAAEMDLPQEQVDGLRMSGLIHDIGKMDVPTEFLVKPGLLSEIEYEAIKVHPQSGYDIVREIAFPWPVAHIILQHHERLDGSGYPQGISGAEILLEARILAVADVVEAMASHRPYRDAHGLELAKEEIARNRGVLYDSQVVDVCLKVFKEKGFTFE